jgi:hypothetical protein
MESCLGFEGEVSPPPHEMGSFYIILLESCMKIGMLVRYRDQIYSICLEFGLDT